MPRISVDNYDTVASWNGSQDLFVVEQPDGTKVATPAMVKQYILAGVTETSEQYAKCSTARNVAAKTVTLPGFILEAGARISVRFTNTGTSNPASGHITLNVNGTGAKEIVDGHTNMTILGYTSGGLFYNNLVNDFIYDGTYWVYMNRDNNTTYTSKAAASGGTATSLCTTGEKYTWNNKQNALTFDNAPTQNSNNPVKSGGIYSRIGDNSGTLTQRIMLSASGNNSYTVTSDSAIMVAQFEGYLSAASDVFEANVQVNGLMIGLLGVREGVACNPTKREQIRIPFRVFKNDVIKITLSLTGSAVGYAALYTT